MQRYAAVRHRAKQKSMQSAARGSRARHIYNNMVSDFHNDLLTCCKKPNFSLLAQASPCVCAVYGGGRTFEQVRDIVHFFFAHRREGMYLSLEDASWLNEENIEEVCGWNPVCVSLTHNESNALAGGCMGEGGLTPLGKRAVSTLAQRGIFVDCAHLNAKSMEEVSDLAPVVNSHTCFCAVNAHPRNITDEQIAKILSAGGLIGVTFVGKFLSEGRASAQDIFRHTDHAVQKFGIWGVCFGSDFFGTDDLPSDVQNFEQEEKMRALFLAAGYSVSDTEKIFRENLQKFLAKNCR